MSKLKSLLLFLAMLMALPATAATTVALATPEQLEAAGLSSSRVEIPGGTVILDNDVTTFSLAYTDEWGTGQAYGVYRNVMVGDSGDIELGLGAVGNTNPTFVSYHDGVMSAGAVFEIKSKADGWITVFTKINPNKQYVVFDGESNPVAYTLGVGGEAYTINYTLPSLESGYIDFDSFDASLYFTADDRPQYPYIVAGLDYAPNEQTGFMTFKVKNGSTYYVSALGSKMTCQGFVFTGGSVEPAVTFTGSDYFPEIQFKTNLSSPIVTPSNEPSVINPEVSGSSFIALSTLENLEMAGLDYEKVFLPGGTVIFDSEAGSFSLAYDDDWGRGLAYRGYPTVRIGDSGDIELGYGAAGNKNPTFVSYQEGVMSAGAVFKMEPKKSGWMTVFTRMNPNKQYVVFEEQTGALPYTLGVAGEGYKINYTLPIAKTGSQAGKIDFTAADADKYFRTAVKTTVVAPGDTIREELPGQVVPQFPYLVAGLDSAPGLGTGFMTFRVQAGKEYYVSGLGTKMLCQGFILTESENAPAITFCETDELPEVKFETTLSRVELAAGDDFEYEGIWYRVLDAHAMTCMVIGIPSVDGENASSIGYQGNIVIPSVVRVGGYEYTVTELGQNCFSESKITSVTLPETLVSLGGWAFYKCENLESVKLPSSLTKIAWGSFCDCSSLSDINIGSNIEEIEGWAFSGCSALPSIDIPIAQTILEENTFAGCSSLTSIVLPDCLTTMKNGVFNGCSSLESIKLPTALSSVGAICFAGCEGLTSVDLPESLISLGERVFIGCSKLESVTLPSSLTEIGEQLFEYCNINMDLTYMANPPIEAPEIGSEEFYSSATLNVPNATLASVQATVPWNKFLRINAKDGSRYPTLEQGQEIEFDGIVYTVIDSEAKTVKTRSGSDSDNPGNNVSGELTIPSTIYYDNNEYTVVEIGSRGFCSLPGLISVTLPFSVRKLGEAAFEGCQNLASVSLSDSLRDVEGFVFDSCTSLASIELPDGLEYVGERMFAHCVSLTSVSLPNTIKEIRGWAFGGCDLSNVDLPYGLEVIGGEAFTGCSKITSIDFPNTLTAIYDRAFSGAGLTSLVLPESLQLIGDGGFYHCNELESVVIPASISSLGLEVFGEGDDKLRSITYNAENPVEANSWVFGQGGETYSSATLYTPNATLAAVQAVEPWNLFQNLIAKDGEIHPSLAQGEDFEYEGILYTVIDSEARTCQTKAGHGGTTSVTAGNIVEGSLSIPEIVSFAGNEYKVVRIGAYGFAANDALTVVDLPESVTSIEEYAFFNSTHIESVSLPSTLTYMGERAFSDCNALTSVELPSSLKDLSKGAFQACINLKTIEFAEGLESIGVVAFESCSGIQTLNLPSTLAVIEYGAFYGCNGLRDVNLPNSIRRLGAEAFFNCVFSSIKLPGSLEYIGEKCFSVCKFDSLIYEASVPISVSEDVLNEYSYENAVLETPNATLESVKATSPWNKFLRINAVDGSIVPFATDIKLSQTSAELKVGETVALEATIVPENVTNKTVTWTSDNENVATVDAEGTVTAISIGEATITASCGSVSATCRVTVVPTQVEGVMLSHTSLSLAEGETATLTATVTPEDATDKTVTWTSSNASVATVSANGEVTAVSPGTADITATSANGISATCSVIVSLKGDDFEYEGLWYTVLDDEAKTCKTKDGSVVDDKLVAGNDFKGDLVIPSIVSDGLYEYSVVAIGRYGFANASALTSVSISERITEIPESAFRNCPNLTSAKIPSSVTSINGYAFAGCSSLADIQLPSGLTNIGYSAFANCSGLKSIEIPESVTRLQNQTFGGCSNLSLIDIPAGVTSFDYGVFLGCASDAEVIYRAVTPVAADPDLFNRNTYRDGRLVMPNATIKEILDVVPWNMFVHIEGSDGSIDVAQEGEIIEVDGIRYEVIDTDQYLVKTIDANNETGELGNVAEGDLVIPYEFESNGRVYTVVEIGRYGFWGNPELRSVSIPASVTHIADGAFYDCERLTSIIWNGSRQMPDVANAIDNPNMLVFVDNEDAAPKDLDHNVVAGDVCDNLVLTPGYAFGPVRKFVAEHSEMTKEFTQKTPIEGCAGWETLALPFQPLSIRTSDGRDLVPFSVFTDLNTQCPFWLYEADAAGEWKVASEISQGVPYIISMPNNEDYDPQYCVDGPVTFVTDQRTAIYPETCTPYVTTWNSGREFRSLWLPLTKEEAANAMGLNVGVSDLTDDDGQRLAPGSAFSVDVIPLPMEAYVTRIDGRRAMPVRGHQSLVMMMNVDEGLHISSDLGEIMILSDRDRKVDVLTMEGVVIRHIELRGGVEYRVENLTRGIYIVAGHKITVK